MMRNRLAACRRCVVAGLLLALLAGVAVAGCGPKVIEHRELPDANRQPTQPAQPTQQKPQRRHEQNDPTVAKEAP